MRKVARVRLTNVMKLMRTSQEKDITPGAFDSISKRWKGKRFTRC